jgi:hypothetical protein
VPELSVEILPARVYVERTRWAQLLNFDLRFTNRLDAEARPRRW